MSPGSRTTAEAVSSPEGFFYIGLFPNSFRVEGSRREKRMKLKKEDLHLKSYFWLFVPSCEAESCWNRKCDSRRAFSPRERATSFKKRLPEIKDRVNPQWERERTKKQMTILTAEVSWRGREAPRFKSSQRNTGVRGRSRHRSPRTPIPINRCTFHSL